MEKIQDGHIDLLGVLFSRHSKKAYALCYRMVEDGPTSEDLVQEAFLRVLRYRQNFRGDSKFSTWLFRIVKNVCIDHLKSHNRETTALEELLNQLEGIDFATAPDDNEIWIAQAAFNSLSSDQQELLILSRVHGIGYREIAIRLGVTEGAARVRVHRTVRELKAIVSELADAES